MDLRLQLNSGSCLVKVTHIYTNSKTLKRRRECVFRGKVKKTQITVCEKLINFNSVKRGRSQCIEKKNRALRYGLHSILTSQCKMAANLRL